MIKANFSAYGTYKTDSLYQWDKNQVLTVEGLDINVVPEVHFQNAEMDRAIKRQATIKNGILSVKIPNSLLQSFLTIKAYIGFYTDTTFTTVEIVEIPVIAKTKPEDYVLEITDEEYYSFSKLENAIANIVSKRDFNDFKDEIHGDLSSLELTVKAQIANIIAHNNDTNGNSELLDIRVDTSGKSHPSAGDAVRSQITRIRKDLVKSKILFDYTLTKGEFIVYESGITMKKSGYSATSYIPVQKDTTIYVYGTLVPEIYFTGLALYDADKKYIRGIQYNMSDDYQTITVTEDGYIRCSFVDGRDCGVYIKLIDEMANVRNIGSDIVEKGGMSIYTLDNLDITNRYGSISNLKLKQGLYYIYFDKVETTSEKKGQITVKAGGDNMSSPSAVIPEGENVVVELTLKNDYTQLFFYGNKDYNNSYGYNCSLTGINIIRRPNNELKNYPFYGKRFGIIGDSFSQSLVWPTTMCKELRADLIINKAQGGAKFAEGKSKSAYQQALEIVSSGVELDYIYVFLGTNDQGNNTPIGSFVSSTKVSDFDLSTYCGGIQACLNILQNAYPDAVIRIGFTPNGSEFASGDITPYIDAMKNIAQHYAVSYMDTMSCGFSCYSDVYASYWERGKIERGFHPSVKGYEAIGKAIARKTLYGD